MSETANTYTADQLKDILEKHRKWNAGEAGGVRASLVRASLDGARLVRARLDGARLDGASLVRARLDGASLVGASLVRASLDGARLVRASLVRASLDDETVMPDSLSWKTYLAETVPALLTAGGRTLEAVLATGCWDCHKWDNCPMHAAFGATCVDDVPPLYREHARRFVHLFDNGLIPKPVIATKEPTR